MSAPNSATMFPGCFVRLMAGLGTAKLGRRFPFVLPNSPGAAMAKKKASKGKSAKMPKKIGGTKVPKEVRSAGDMLASLVTSPMARELVADALIAVAGVLAGNKKTHDAVAGAGAEAASGAKDIGQTATGAVAEVVAGAARRILPSAMSDENDDRQGKRAGEDAAIPGNGRKKRKDTPDQRRDH